ncbi:MAG TPA: hypothetical protein VMN03_05615, partial [Burkholderiales bacterium]|nr:hypothetical protein [Burkholderiales bacterium]
MPSREPRSRWESTAAFIAAVLLVALLYGALPFIALPTYGQAVWSMGFAQSLAIDGPLALRASHFGVPQPAAMAFGLAGAYPASLLIMAGMHPADAYSAMAVLWLSLGVWGAWRIGLRLGLCDPLAILGGVLWMSMPTVWAHSGYSMLSLGIALQPFYLWAAMRLFTASGPRTESILVALVYVATCVLAVFMDGYSFVMFAAGSSALAAGVLAMRIQGARSMLAFALPVHALGFLTAVLLYFAYVGRLTFDQASLEFFRGWGLDLAFIAIPTKGVHWVWDLAGLSVARSPYEFFGDTSVWMTTFSVPIIVTGLAGWWLSRSRIRWATAFLLIALLGFYLALGPTLKVNAVKLPGMGIDGMMPVEFGIMPTGTAWLSEHMPGFKTMRAVYRWSALGFLGFWALTLLLMVRLQARNVAAAALLAVLLVLSFLPHPLPTWNDNRNNRKMFMSMESELLPELQRDLRGGELVAFLPYGNDFLANYVAPRIGFRTYNAGGDKNLMAAGRHWPQVFRDFGIRQIGPGFADRVVQLLGSHKADVVVLPYFDMLVAAHTWPAPTERKDALAPAVTALKSSRQVVVEEHEYYAVVRLSREPPEFAYPIVIAKRSTSMLRAIGRGWHDIGPQYVWSRERAELELP